MGKLFIILGMACLLAYGADWKRAEELYQRTEYKASLETALSDRQPSAEGYGLIGRDYFMLGEYRKAMDAFHKALALEPDGSEYHHWMGRTYGRKAETASPLFAPANAAKARQYFERAVQLDPANEEALNDLFDYYLEAPGFLGGGFDKALEVAKRIRQINPAEYYFAEAQIAERRKEYDTAEQHLKRAIVLAPLQVGRVLDLAKYLAKRGRYTESDAAFTEADHLAPNSPKVMFARADTYIKARRNLDEARQLLETYLRSNLSPDDPPREEANRLLKQCRGI